MQIIYVEKTEFRLILTNAEFIRLSKNDVLQYTTIIVVITTRIRQAIEKLIKELK